MTDRVGRARDRALDAERTARAAHERRLAGSELSGDRHHVARGEPLGEARADLFSLLGGHGFELHPVSLAVVRPRWDIDERGQGVGDARRLLPEARALLERMDAPHWVTEDADAHLLPHLRRVCERDEVPLELRDARVEEDGTLVVDCRLEGVSDGWTAGVAAFALLGRIAETGTFVEKRESDERLELDVVTGVVSDEGRYATHGHTLRVCVTT
jgi:hypothetical protein